MHEQENEKIPQNKKNKIGRSIMTGFAAGVVGSFLTLSIVPLTGYYEDIVANQISYASEADAEETEVNKQVESNHDDTHAHSISETIEEASKSIVGVINKQKQSFPSFYQTQTNELNNEAVEAGTGSGVIYKINEQEAYVITNQHVIEGASEIDVSLESGETVQAELVGSDILTDIAVLKIDADSVESTLSFANSDDLRVGEQVLAIGNPLGLDLSRTVTQGIVSALNRSISVETSAGEWDLDVIQTDAAINPGNSGGALINTSGEVVGINSLKIAENGIEGLGFAIPSNDLIPLVDELIETGQISRPYLGIGLANLEQVPRSYLPNLPVEVETGVAVTAVEPNSSAERGGLQSGDVIVTLAGEDIQNSTQLRKQLYQLSVGDEVEVEVYRQGELLEFTIQLATANQSNLDKGE
ncbi:peptidase S1 [Bacillus sp. TS-2]|nr:peptidase S1 [Bacillus sp. TS-2]